MKMTAKEMETVLTLVGKADLDQLAQVISRVKLQRTFISNQNRRSITVGDTVEFVAHGKVINGSVTKINRKTVMVRQAGFGNWKVPAEMLKKVA